MHRQLLPLALLSHGFPSCKVGSVGMCEQSLLGVDDWWRAAVLRPAVDVDRLRLMIAAIRQVIHKSPKAQIP